MLSINKNATHSAAPPGRLGTFAGVFTPSVLTILGIILFLRLGDVTGAAGLARALGMVALANLIPVLTSVSPSAAATNLRVKGGGDYYLISRTLGLAFGGAIGIVLFLAQSVSIAFYGIGPLRANTILLNRLNPQSKVGRGFKEFLFGRRLRSIHHHGCNIAILYTDEKKWENTTEPTPDGENMAVLRAKPADAEASAEKARRRAVKARAKAQAAVNVAEEQNIQSSGT